jgi:hypothetical protein
MTDLDPLIVNLPAAQVGHITPIEVANPASGFQFGVICGNTGDAQAFVLVPDR